MKKFINNADEISLSPGEKASIRDALLRHIELTTIQSPYVYGTTSDKRNWSRSFWFVSSVAQKYIIPVAVIVIIVLGAGTGALAQNALPGEILYPVKIHVNENLESFMAITPKEVAQVEIKQAVRRLTEAESLSMKGELTASSTETIRSNFISEISSVNNQITKLESKGATSSAREIRDEFDREVNHHSNMLQRISRKDNVTSDVLNPVSTKQEDKGGNQEPVNTGRSSGGRKPQNNNRSGNGDKGGGSVEGAFIQSTSTTIKFGENSYKLNFATTSSPTIKPEIRNGGNGQEIHNNRSSNTTPKSEHDNSSSVSGERD